MLREEIEAYAAATFPRWPQEFLCPQNWVVPGWSIFYLTCRRCSEPVLNDQNWQQGHLQHHILIGDTVVDPKLKPGERKLVYA